MITLDWFIGRLIFDRNDRRWPVGVLEFSEASTLSFLLFETLAFSNKILDLLFELFNLSLLLNVVSLEVIELGDCIFELLLKLSNLSILLGYDVLFLSNELLGLLNQNVVVHLNTLLLIDVTLPDLNVELAASNILLVFDSCEVAIGQALQVVDHLVKQADLALDDVLVLLDELTMLRLELAKFVVIDLVAHSTFDLLLLLVHADDLFVLIFNLLEIVLHKLVGGEI